MKKTNLLILLSLFYTDLYAAQAPWVGSDLKGQSCQGGGQGYGPYDYTKAEDRPFLPIVDQHHLSPNVENHIKGQEGSVVTDLDYTLRAVPNHHKALLSVIRYEYKLKKKILLNPAPLLTAPECYLQRAIHFSPEDSVSYSLYGYYLWKMGNSENAVKYFEKALKLDPENAKFAYSFSLLLIDLKRYEEAVKYAKIAYQQKGTPKGLKQKLEKLGVWREATPESSVGDNVPLSPTDTE